MRALFACFVSALVAAAGVTATAIIEHDFIFEVLGVMLIVFLYALAIAVMIGLPFHFFFKKAKAAHFAIAGSLTGTAVLVPALISTPGDSSLLKLALTLLIAGSIAGWTFHSVLKRPRAIQSAK